MGEISGITQEVTFKFVMTSFGAGFIAGDYTATPAEAPEQVVKVDESILPATIRQILGATLSGDSDILIDGVPRKLVTIVGQVTKASVSNIAHNYEINDGTGLIQVEEFSDSELTTGLIPVGTYVQVSGRMVRTELGKITGYYVEPITDFNQIAFHRSYALYTHLQTTRGLPEGSAYAAIAPVVVPSTTTNTTQGGNYGAFNQNSNQDEQIKNDILEVISSSTSGISAEELAQRFPQLSASSLDAILHTLVYTGSAIQYENNYRVV